MGLALPLGLLLRRWALTSPFHPYRQGGNPLSRRYFFCGAFRRLDLNQASRVYPRLNLGYAASCPVEFGLSSSILRRPGRLERSDSPSNHFPFKHSPSSENYIRQSVCEAIGSKRRFLILSLVECESKCLFKSRSGVFSIIFAILFWEGW